MDLVKLKCKYVGTPRYELKQLLISLRKVYEISSAEMAKKLGIDVTRLIEYERHPRVIDAYEAAYIEVLGEYVSLASKEKMSFEEALKIYMNQRNLNRYNTLYKMALFGNIVYDSMYVNMNSVNENDAIKELPVAENSIEYKVWNDDGYMLAFFLLGTIREMLEIDVKAVATYVNISSGCLKNLETGLRSYKTLTNLREIVRKYSLFLKYKMKEKFIKKDVYEIISSMIETGYTLKMEKMKLVQILLDKLYE